MSAWNTARVDIRTSSYIKDARPKEDPCWKNCPCVKEDRGRNAAKGF